VIPPSEGNERQTEREREREREREKVGVVLSRLLVVGSARRVGSGRVIASHAVAWRESARARRVASGADCVLIGSRIASTGSNLESCPEIWRVAAPLLSPLASSSSSSSSLSFAFSLSLSLFLAPLRGALCSRPTSASAIETASLSTVRPRASVDQLIARKAFDTLAVSSALNKTTGTSGIQSIVGATRVFGR